MQIIPSEVKFTFTTFEVAKELGIKVEKLRIILKLFGFNKIFGQYRLTERNIEKLKKILGRND